LIESSEYIRAAPVGDASLRSQVVGEREHTAFAILRRSRIEPDLAGLQSAFLIMPIPFAVEPRPTDLFIALK
jgi:hypothetical protein